jgi:6-phosphogluconolactonase/glucosamine-6-phosphate isomerase/deaminase
MRVEVYDTEGEALDAAAEYLAAVLRGAGATPLAALPGERSGRAFMMALAARDDVPWEVAHWCVTHEIVQPGPGDEASADLLRQEIVAPRRLPAAVAILPDAGSEASVVAGAYAERLAAQLGAGGSLDAVCVTLERDGAVAGLGRCAVGPAATPLVVHGPAVVSLCGRAIDTATAVVVVATGSAVATAVSRLLTDDDAARRGGPDVRPSSRVTWFADRRAVANLLSTAQLVGDEGGTPAGGLDRERSNADPRA